MQQEPMSLLNKLDYQGQITEQRKIAAELLQRLEKINRELGYFHERRVTNRYMEKQSAYRLEYNHQGAGHYEQQKEYGQEHFDYNHGIKSSQEVDGYRESGYNERGLKQIEDQSINQSDVFGNIPGNEEMPQRLFDDLLLPGLVDQYDERGNREQHKEQTSLLDIPHEDVDIISKSREHHNYIQQEHQHGIMELQREQGHVNTSRGKRSHMDSISEQQDQMELAMEQHGHMDALSEPEREQRGHLDTPRDECDLIESPWEQHGFMAMKREQSDLMDPPKLPPMSLMDSSNEPRSFMATPMNQLGLMNPSSDARDQIGNGDAHRDQPALLDSPRQQKEMSQNERNRQNKEADLQMKLLLQQENLREHEEIEQLKRIEQQIQVKMDQQELKQQIQQAELIIARTHSSSGGDGSIRSLFDLPAQGKRPAPSSMMSDSKKSRTVSEGRGDRRPSPVPERRRSPINRSIERQHDRTRRTRFSSPAKKQSRKQSGSTRNATSKSAATSNDRDMEGRGREDKGKDKKGKSRDETNKNTDQKKKMKDDKGKNKEQANTKVIVIADDIQHAPAKPTEDDVVMSADRRDRRPSFASEQKRSPGNRSIEPHHDRKRQTQCLSPAKKQNRRDKGSTIKPATTRNDMSTKVRARDDKGKGKDKKGKSRKEYNKHKDEKENSKHDKGEDKEQHKAEVIVIVDEEHYDPTKSTEDVAKTFTKPTSVGTGGAIVAGKTDSTPEEESIVTEIYDSSIAVGQRYIVSGFFCKLCQKFYNNVLADKISHCQSLTHYKMFKNIIPARPAGGVETSKKLEISRLFKIGEKSEDKVARQQEILVESRNHSMNESSRETIVINMNIK